MNEHSSTALPEHFSFDTPVVRMRTPGDVAEALPYLLGFYPSDSAVALGLQGQRRRQGGTVRIDIPEPAAYPAAAEEVVRFLTALSEHRDATPDAVILYVCRDPEPGGDGARVRDELRPLHLALTAAFATARIPVQESLCLSGGRWYSFTCTEPGCCPPEGTPLVPPGTASPMAAAAAVAGITVRGSLRELHRELDPVAAPAAADVQRALRGTMPRLSAEIRRPGGAAEARERTVELAEEALARFKAGQEELTPGQSARLLLGLQDRQARDRVAEWLEPEELAAAERLWRYLARRCTIPFDACAAPPLALLGWTAWIRGDVVLARVALGRALVADPRYTFAQLLHEAINCGAVPDALRASLRRERRTRERRARAARKRRQRPCTA